MEDTGYRQYVGFINKVAAMELDADTLEVKEAEWIDTMANWACQPSGGCSTRIRSG